MNFVSVNLSCKRVAHVRRAVIGGLNKSLSNHKHPSEIMSLSLNFPAVNTHFLFSNEICDWLLSVSSNKKSYKTVENLSTF